MRSRESGGDTRGTLLIRADAYTAIGTGHVMRCLALAQAWKDRGGAAAFMGYWESDALRRRIEEEGFRFIPAAGPYPDAGGTEETLEAHSSLHEEGPTCDWIVMDGYHFDPSFQMSLKETGRLLLLVDDMGHMPFYHGNILLNQNIDAERLSYHCDSDTRMLLGIPYVLLRREFLEWSGVAREIPREALRILVTMGGADSKNTTRKVITALRRINMEDLEVGVVVGPSNPHLEEIEEALRGSPFAFSLFHSADNMPELMAGADIAISGGGSTCWEMACMGLPNLILVLAENQRPVAEGLERAGCSVNLGFFEDPGPDELAKKLGELIHDEGRRRSMSVAGRNLIDGRGAFRVLEKMEEIQPGGVRHS